MSKFTQLKSFCKYPKCCFVCSNKPIQNFNIVIQQPIRNTALKSVSWFMHATPCIGQNFWSNSYFILEILLCAWAKEHFTIHSMEDEHICIKAKIKSLSHLIHHQPRFVSKVEIPYKHVASSLKIWVLQIIKFLKLCDSSLKKDAVFHCRVNTNDCQCTENIRCHRSALNDIKFKTKG